MTIDKRQGVELRSKLTLFDVTNLVVGAIIGADIYVASAFGTIAKLIDRSTI